MPLDRLRELEIFRSLRQPELESIRHQLTALDIAEGDTLFFEGEAPTFLYIITAGRFKLIKHSEDGRDVMLHIALPGDLVGGVSAFGRRPHTFTAQALVASQVFQVAGRDFSRLMERFPAVATRALADLIDHLTDAHETMKSLAVDRVDRRIARQLLKLAAQVGRPVADGVEINVPLTRQDVADLAGTTMESAIRVLSRWRKSGWVRTDRGRIVILDQTALENV